MHGNEPLSLHPPKLKRIQPVKIIRAVLTSFYVLTNLYKSIIVKTKWQSGLKATALHLTLVRSNLFPRRQVVATLFDVAKIYDKVWRYFSVTGVFTWGLPTRLCVVSTCVQHICVRAYRIGFYRFFSSLTMRFSFTSTQASGWMSQRHVTVAHQVEGITEPQLGRDHCLVDVIRLTLTSG